jgi:murein L,D-transpeptidase YcbB/YkuD
LRKPLLKLALAALIATAGMEMAPAQAQGLFENLFGPRKVRIQKARKKSYFNNGLFESDREWNQRRQNRIRILRGGSSDEFASNARQNRKKRPVQNYSDPEGVPGLGWGNPVYAAPRLVPLANPALAKVDAATAQNPEILKTLTDIKSGIRVEMPLREPILALYKANGYKPVWLDQGKPSERALKLLAVAATADKEGLQPQDYLPPALTSFTDVEGQLRGDAALLAAFDVGMTAASVKLAQHLSGGRFDPNRLSLYNDLPSQQVNPAVALNVLAHSPFPETYLSGLAPTHPAYGLMKAELAKLRDGGEVPETTIIPEGQTLKRGASDPRILLVRDRLNSLGFIDPDSAEVDAEVAMVLDAELSKALKAYQSSVKIKATGRLDNATVGKLNGNTRESDIARLVYNLERVRWLPRQLGEKHVFVNQPAFEVRVMENGQQVWRSNVIVGRQTTQTASFYDEMETVVFNPSWGMPQSILVNEYLGKLRRDPGYFDRIGYKVVNQKGKPVSSRSINWGSYSTSSPVGVQQPPGAKNALGELKFLFPNKHSIYMHDTPTRNLFVEAVRAFSHGCVRVENPREFATVLLGWDRAKVDEMTDSGASESVKLDRKIPVYMTYFTAWPDSSGKIHYFNDIYERDAAMARALGTLATRQAAAISGAVVQN